MGAFHLAQANISTGRWAFDRMMDDLSRLGRDPMLEAYNLSVWESVEALWAYAFSGVHLEAVKRSKQWFEPESALDVMWWIPAEHRPTTEEGLAKLDLVKRNGPTPEGFTFRRRFPAPT